MERQTVKIIVAIMAILLQAVASEQETRWNIKPTHIAFRNEVTRQETNEASCTPLEGAILNSAEDTEYVRCSHPTRLTDSDKSLPIFTDPNAVYVLGGEQEQILFTFSSQKRFDSITIHYYSNPDNQGLPKLRFYAVPEDFEVWDSTRNLPENAPSSLVDQILPGSEDTGLRNKTITFEQSTTKVLLTKFYSTDFRFFLSEVEFITSDPDSVDIIATTASTTVAMTTTSTTTSSSESTDSETTTETTLSETYNVEVQGLSGDLRTHGQQSILCVIVLTLIGVLTMYR